MRICYYQYFAKGIKDVCQNALTMMYLLILNLKENHNSNYSLQEDLSVIVRFKLYL